jgi:DNA polymerase-3 subunit gamma/tau
VKFILATTDPQKLPVTVLSRCLQFHLKALSSEQISKQLADILQSEKMPFEPEALTRLAYAAEGSMRDALSLLDQAIAYSNSQVTTVAIKSMLSTIEATFIYDILEALVTQQAEKLIQITQNLAEQSLDFANTLEELLSLLHQIAIKQHAASIEIGSWDSDKIAHFAGRLAPQDVQLFYQIALIGRRDLPLAPTARIGLEMVLLRMLAFQPKTADLSLLAQTKSLEPVVKSRDTGGLGQSITPDLALSAQTKSLESTPRSGDVVDLSQSTAVSTPSSVSAPLASSWSEIVRHLNLTGMTAAIAAHCVLEKLSDDEIVIAIDPAQRILLNKKQEERLTQALQAYFKKPLCLTVITGPTNMETPAVKAQQKQSQQKSQALDAMHQDQNVQNIIATFNAQILPNSVTIGDKDSSD